MTKFILHGGFTSAKNDLNDSFYQEIIEDIPDNGNILLVYFSREPQEWEKLFEGGKELILKEAKGRAFNFTLANKSDFLAQLKEAQAIYLIGGDTTTLLDALKEYPDFHKAIKNKVVVGSSAGAYVLAKYYYSNSKASISEGLGILPIKVICHYKSETYGSASTQDPIELFKQYPTDLELVVLKDYEWRVFMLEGL